MSVFRSEKTAFLKVSVTKDGLIKTTQVKRKADGSIPDVAFNDPGNVFQKDIPASQYKGLLYALPLTAENYLTVSIPAIMAEHYKVEKRAYVAIDAAN